MKKLFSILLALGLVVSLAACGSAQNQTEKQETVATTEVQTTGVNEEGKKLKTVVTILPQVEWVKAVAGDLAEVTALLPPGASPEVYQASPKEMIALEEADIYFTISVPVEVEGIIPNTVTKAQIVNLAAEAAKKYPDLFFEEGEHEHEEEAAHAHEEGEHKEAAEHKHEEGEHKEEAAHAHEEGKNKEAAEHKHEEGEHKEEAAHAHEEGEHKEAAEHKHKEGEHKEEADHAHEEGEHEHHHSGRDPHIWMSPKRAAVMVEAIRDALAAADPQNAEAYQKNAEAYLQKLKEMDEKLSAVLAQVKNKSFIIMHPSMGYFAEDYGLIQVSVEKEGKQATAEHLKSVIDHAKEHDIKVIFYQKEFDNNQAKTIAAEVGGEVMELEPLAQDYLKNLEKLSEVFSATLK